MKRIGVIICFVLIMLGVYSDAYADTDIATEETYNVTITWGDMSYIYNAISANWDTDNLIYNDITKGQWIERTSNSSGKIRIDNSSSSKINIGASFVASSDGIMDDVTGVFYEKKNENSEFYIKKGDTLDTKVDKIVEDVPSKKTIYFMPEGLPRMSWFGERNVGNITIELESENADSVDISHKEIVIENGFTKQLSIINNTDEVIWQSDNSHIASIDNNGLVTASGVGFTKITATIGDKEYECIVKVKSKNGVALSHYGLILHPNETKKVELKWTEDIPTWKSNDGNIVSIDTEGLVTAKAVGETTVMATLNEENFYINILVMEDKEGEESDECSHLWVVEEESMCSHYNKGYYVVKCVHCNTVQRLDLEKVEEHKYVERIVEPTCIETGMKYTECECGLRTSEVLPTVEYALKYTVLGSDEQLVKGLDSFSQMKTYINSLDATLTSATLENKNYYIKQGQITREINTENIDFGSMYSGGKVLITVDMSKFYTENLVSIWNMFNGSTKLETINLDGIDTSKVTSMRGLFRDCNSLKNVDVSGFDTSKVTDMYFMFGNCNSIEEIDVSNFDTSLVKDMSGMFIYNTNLKTLDVSKWNTESVTNMYHLFAGCNKLETIDVSGFNTSNVTTMECMFTFCYAVKELDVSGFDTTKVTNCRSMFAGCNLVQVLDVSNFKTSNMEHMGSMFNDCYAVKVLDTANWDMSAVTRVKDGWSTAMFRNCRMLEEVNLNFSGNTSTMDFSYVFQGCYALKEVNITNMEGVSITSMRCMFNKCTSLEVLDLTSFNTSSVTDTNSMFSESTNLKTIYVDELWNMENVTNGDGMFYNCTSLVGVIPYDKTKTNVTYANYITGYLTKRAVYKMIYTSTDNPGVFTCGHYESYSDMKVDITSKKTKLTSARLIDGEYVANDTSETYDMSKLFSNATVLTSVDLSRFSTTKVTNTSRMFFSSNKIESIDMDYSDMSNVTDISEMFAGCNALKELDTSMWDLSSVTTIKYIWNTGVFSGCKALESISINMPNREFDYSYFFSDCHSVKTISINNVKALNTAGMFSTCRALESVDVSQFDVSLVGDMSYMFQNCNKLQSIDVSSFDTSNVINMAGMFNGCNVVTELDIAGFDTSKVTNLSSMFLNCYEITSLDVTNFTTDIVTNMANMFNGCKKLSALDVTNFNTANVTNMNGMFTSCNSLTELDVSSFNTSQVTNMGSMFNAMTSITKLDVSNFDTSKVTIINGMFRDCSKMTTLNLGNMNTSSVTNMSWLFSGCNILPKIDVSNFDTSNVTDVSYMFNACYSLQELDVSGFETGQIKNMTSMFNNCKVLEVIDVSGFDTSNVTLMTGMFGVCNKVKTLDVSNFNTSKVTSMDGMFGSCYGITTLDVDGFDTSNVTNMRMMFNDCTALETIDVSNFNMSKVQNISQMFCYNRSLKAVDTSGWQLDSLTTTKWQWNIGIFYDCQQLESITIDLKDRPADLSYTFEKCYKLKTLNIYNTAGVTSFAGAFRNCNVLTDINIEDFDTENVTDMSAMFQNCYALTSVDVSNFDTSKVTNMSNMFNSCTALTGIDISNFYMENVTSMGYMFNECKNLEYITMSNYGVDKVVYLDNAFKGCVKLTTLDLSKFDTRNNTTTLNMFYGCTALQSIYTSDMWSMDKVTNSSQMFYNCTSLVGAIPYTATKVTGDYANADTGYFTRKCMYKVSYITSDSEKNNVVFFENYNSLKTFVSGKTDIITLKIEDYMSTNREQNIDASNMFKNCTCLLEVDLSDLYTSNIINMSNMFEGCSNLVTIYVADKWNISNVVDSTNMFNNCTSLVGAVEYDINNAKDKTYANWENGYLTYNGG